MQIATNGNGQCMMVLGGGGGNHMNNSDAASSTTSAVLYQHHHPQPEFNNNVSSNALSNKPLQLDHAAAAAGAVSTRRQKSMRRTNLPVGSPLDVKPIDDEERQLLLPFYSSTTCNDNNNKNNISFNTEAVENDDNDAGADASAASATGVELLDEEMALLDDEILHGLCGSSRRHRRRRHRLDDVDGDGIPSLDDDADDDREDDEADDVDVDVDDDDDDDDTDSTKSKVERFSENTIFDYLNLDGEVGPNRVEATCRLCARTVKATVGVTSNFLTHLRTHHKDMFKQYEQHRSEVTKKRGRPLKSLHQIKQRFSFAMRKRRREIIFSAFSEFETEDVPNDTSRICATCKLCNVTIRGTKTVSSNFYSHLKRKHPHDFKLLSNQAERELGKFPPTQPSISPTSFKNLLMQQQQNSTNSNGGGECSQRHQHQQQLIRHQHHQLHQSAAQFFQRQQRQQQQPQNGGLMFSTQQQEQKFFHQPSSVGVEHHQPTNSLSTNLFIESLTTAETLSPRLPPTQSDHDAADAVTVSESKFSPTPPPALGGVGDINRVRAKTFNTILVSADVGGNRTDLVITKVNDASDVGLLLAPTRSLLDFLSHFTEPRTEADGFVLYSFAGDCVAIVDELRKMGFTVINMSYLAPAGGATTTTTTIVAGESTVTVVEEEELQLIDQPHTDMRIINDDEDDNTTTTQEPSSFSAASVADAVSTASIIGSSSVLATAATKQHQHQQPSTLNNECEKFVWLLTALPSTSVSSN